MEIYCDGQKAFKMDHRFGDCKHLRRILGRGMRRSNSAAFVACLDRDRHCGGRIDGNIVLGGGVRARGDRHSGETSIVGLGRQPLAKTPLIRATIRSEGLCLAVLKATWRRKEPCRGLHEPLSATNFELTMFGGTCTCLGVK